MEWMKKLFGQRKGFSLLTWPESGIGYPSRKNIYYLTKIGYHMNAVASASIKLIAKTGPMASLKVYREFEDGTLEEESGHWLSELMDRPNGSLSPFDLWFRSYIYLQTAGEIYWELRRRNNSITSPIIEIYPLRPDRVEILTDGENQISGYRYQVEKGGVIDFAVHEILRVSYPDPLSENDALSPLAQIARELGIDNNASEFTQGFFQNSAIPPAVISSDQPLTREEADEAERRWWQKFGGRNKGKIPVLGKGMDIKQLSMTFKDMEFESIRAFTESRICAAFGVDPVLLPTWVGIRYGGKYSNYKEARRHLWEETIIPIMRMIEAKINSQLLFAEKGVIAKFDLSNIDALSENEDDRWKRAISAFDKGIITLNQALQYLGYDDEGDAGDVRLYQLNEDLRKIDGLQAPQQEQPQAQEEEQPQDQDGDSGVDGEEEASLSTIEKKQARPQNIERYTEAIKRMQDQEFSKMERIFRSFFDKWKRKAVGVIRAEKAISPAEYATILLGIEAVLLEMGEDVESMSLEVFLETAIIGGQTVSNLLGLDFNPDDKDMITRLRQYSRLYAAKVMETTRKDLHDLLTKAQSEEWVVTQLRDEIRAKFSQYSEKRAETIARTEVIRMTNMGTATSYIQNGFVEMSWHAIHDAKTCPFCAKMDGKKVVIGLPFAKEGEMIETEDEEGNRVSYAVSMGNVLQPPLHVRCRCGLLPE